MKTKKLIKLNKEEYQSISLLLLYFISMSILTLTLIIVLLTFFKDKIYFLIIAMFFISFFVIYKLNKFKELFYK